MAGSSCLPQWLSAILGEKFFSPCMVHENVKKNEKNIFCFDCCTSICPHCLPPHRSHRLLQIRSAKVVFINQRPQSRPFRGSGKVCSTCRRSLQDPYRFCSLACKVSHLVKREGGVARHLYECEYLPLSEEESLCDNDVEQMTPDSVLESPTSMLTSSGSSGGGSVGCRTLACTATTDFVIKKKRSNLSASRNSSRPTCSPASEIALTLNKRKGNPNRAPFH